jgi:cytochrome c biogenesis protein CcmG, thiol:disulfide interchange protein DsbE
MSSRAAIGILTCALIALVVVALVTRGDDDSGVPATELSAEEAAEPLTDAPPELVALRGQANEILDEGIDGFEARLAELEGVPVVVNKWASWCAPCREEFPYFQSQAIEHEDEVAFVGLLSDDGPETGAEFLAELPLPYPSYLDPDKAIANSIGAGREFPSTLFIDASGEVTYTKLGPYTDEASLAADIDRYAAPG